MTEYKIGQIITSNREWIAEKAISGEKVIIPKGNKIIIGADGLAHHIRNGMIQPLGNATVKGYDTQGIAEYLTTRLKFHLPISEMLDDYDITKTEFQEELEYALDEIGL